MSRCRPDHKIYGTCSTRESALAMAAGTHSDRSVGGYALVALLAVMSLLALFALAAAPSIQQQVQREKETEAIFRGEQVANAIRDYYLYRRALTNAAGPQALPSSMDQLLEGIQIPGRTKKLQILRVSASRDPLSADGEWGFVGPQTEKLIAFQRDVIAYSGSSVPLPQNPQMLDLQRVMVPQMSSVLDTGTSDSSPSNDDESEGISGPFIGVSSRSRRGSVLHYYGIQQHNQWVFTPLFRW